MAGTSESPERGGVPAKRSFDEVREEDAATMKASEELKNTTISDKAEAHDGDAKDSPESQQQGSSPSATADDKDLQDRTVSPKKKRVREDDGDKTEKGRVPSSGSTSSADRADRSEPEKKRPREESEDEDSTLDKVLMLTIPSLQCPSAKYYKECFREPREEGRGF